MKPALLCLSLVSLSAFGATFGVPTNLTTAGVTQTSSVDPPGWLELFGTGAGNALGDLVHQHRFFIEVTGTTLDVRIFDPGSSGARDFTGTGNVTTTFTLLRPNGSTLAAEAIGDDTAVTDNRLVRLTSGNVFVALNTGTHFTGLTAGLYELRVATGAGAEGNFYGLDVRATTGANAAHYTVYTMRTSSPASGFLVGGNTAAGTPSGTMTQPATAFVNVNRGCTFDINNFDGDGTNTASITPVDGTPALGIALSGDNAGVTQTSTAELTTAQNLLINNYGLWRLQFDPGPTNAIDWAFADFSGWAGGSTNTLRTPTNPLRVYLPNGYAPVPGNANAVAPGVPTISLGAAIASGPNPPVANTTTRFTITLATRNNTLATMTAVQLSVGLPTGVALVAGTQQCLINGVVVACADGSGTGYRRATIASLAAGSTASLRFDVNFSRPAGLQNLSGPPLAGATPPNTTSWVQYTSNFATTERLGPVCNMRVQVGGTVSAPTPARISGVYVGDDDITFDTAVQLGTVGFRVFTARDEKGTERSAVHEGIIASTAPDSFEPQRYVVKTTKLKDEWLFIEEVQSAGAPHVIASMRINEQRRTPPPLTLKEKLTTTRALRAAKPSALQPSVSALKLFVSKPGRVSVTRAELEAAGLPPGARVELFHLGAPVRFTWDASNTTLTFNSVAFSTQYTGSAVYVVTTGNTFVPAPEVTFTRLEPQRSNHRVERNSIYFALTPWSDSPWFWGLARSNAAWPAAPAQGQFDLADVTRLHGTTPVRVKLLGRSGHHHHVEASINGVSIGSVDFDGATAATLEGTIAASALRETGNTLGLTLSSTAISPDDEGALGFVYLDWLEVDALAPVFHRDVTVDAIAPYDATLPSVRGADYLIVTHADFLETARDLAALKRQEGLRPVVVKVERAYDTFASGTFEANAVKELISHVAGASPKLRYVVLLGDDTVDPRDFMGLHGRSFIPSIDGWDGQLGRVPSESRYADLDDDGLPDLAIGRLPLQTTADGLTLLDKIGHYPMRNQRAPQHVVFVDARGPNDDDFLARATALNQSIGAPMQVIDTSTGVAQARQTLAQVLSRGDAASLHYIGHGAPTAWTSRGLWNVNDSSGLTPASSDTLGFQWSCFAQWYQYLFGPSVGESLLLMKEGGVTASFGPAGITDPAQQALLSEAVYRNVYQRHLPLGDAILEAKRALPPGTDSAALIDGWNLLGDPAMIPSPLATGRAPWTPHEEPSEPTDGSRNKKAVQATPPRRIDAPR